jgi:uncharacterized protein
MVEQTAILIAAISGRALAASARRAGYLPLVTDFFGDQDTLRVAHAHARPGGTLTRGFEAQALFDALTGLSDGHRPVGIVCGTGFEDRPELLRSIACRWRLFGNDAATVAKIKSPDVFAKVCGALGIPFPELSLVRPARPDDWLVKRRGGAGGAHIGSAQRSDRPENEIYYQRKVPGIPISCLFLADGARTTVLGLSAQWSLPTPRQPYRYGGAVRPANIARHMDGALAAAVQHFAAAIPLVGLNSADFLVDGESFWLLEINPRPGATLDLFEPPDRSLFALHMAACSGELPAAAFNSDGAKAAAIVYAEHMIGSVPDLDWPDWTADRPLTGGAIKVGEPVCTVYADGSTPADARALADQRRKLVLAWMRAGQ